MDHPTMVLVSPTGTRILGTLERLRAQAEILDRSVRPGPLGGFEFEYEGTTHIFWEGQETVVRDTERIFLDAEGNEFAESELKLVAESPGEATSGRDRPRGNEASP